LISKEKCAIDAGMPQVFSIPPENERLVEEIRDLCRQRNAVILAHNYQFNEVQEIADVTGDSRELSSKAAAIKADVSNSALHFMPKRGDLCPNKRCFFPVLRLAVHGGHDYSQELRAFQRHPSGDGDLFNSPEI
jgi:quinolinate synthase